MLLSNLQAELAEIFLTNDKAQTLLRPPQNVSIYHHNINSALINALAETYPLIQQLVGDDFFKCAARAYLEQYPSRNSNLHHYGEYFGDFLSRYEPAADLVYLSEVASFEWLCRKVYFAPDHAAFDVTALAAISAENYDHLHFTLHPASQLVQFQYPILRIIALCKNEIDEEINLNEGGVNLLIIRREQEIMLVPLTFAELTFLDLLHEQKSVSESLHTALMIDPNFKLDEKLPSWIQDKTIVDCYLRKKYGD